MGKQERTTKETNNQQRKRTISKSFDVASETNNRVDPRRDITLHDYNEHHRIALHAHLSLALMKIRIGLANMMTQNFQARCMLPFFLYLIRLYTIVITNRLLTFFGRGDFFRQRC
jgi:hypothetical protein